MAALSLTMLFIFLVCLLVLSIECAKLPDDDLNPKDKVVVKLDPNQVVDAFKSVVSSDYLRDLAHDLALRAAEQFLTVMNNKQRSEIMNVSHRKPEANRVSRLKEETVPQAVNAASMKAEVVEEIERTASHTNPEAIAPELNINVKQAMTLLREPSPDGDNLDLISPNLSEDEDAKTTKSPVIHLMKVNGKYFRRLFRLV